MTSDKGTAPSALEDETLLAELKMLCARVPRSRLTVLALEVAYRYLGFLFAAGGIREK